MGVLEVCGVLGGVRMVNKVMGVIKLGIRGCFPVHVTCSYCQEGDLDLTVYMSQSIRYLRDMTHVGFPSWTNPK